MLIMLFLKKANAIQREFLVYLYFAITVFDVILNLFFYNSSFYFLNPLLPIILLVLFFINSEICKSYFLLLSLAILLWSFCYKSEVAFLEPLAIVSLFSIEFIIIVSIIQFNNLKNFVPVVIVFLPIIYLLLLLFSQTNQIPIKDYFLILSQDVIFSFIVGLCFSISFINEAKNKWLFLFGVLSILVYFLYFLVKYYFPSADPLVYKSAMSMLIAALCYAFYSFMSTPVLEKISG